MRRRRSKGRSAPELHVRTALPRVCARCQHRYLRPPARPIRGCSSEMGRTFRQGTRDHAGLTCSLFGFIRRPGCPLDPLEGTAHRKLASMLDRLGFPIEVGGCLLVLPSRHAAGTRCTWRLPRKSAAKAMTCALQAKVTCEAFDGSGFPAIECRPFHFKTVSAGARR